MWVEIVLALVVEGFQELQQWLQARGWLRAARPAPSGPPTSRYRAESSAVVIDEILGRHARKHAGVAVGVLVDGEISTVGVGRVRREELGAPAADTIFEIGSITKVFTATVLADMVEEGAVALDDPVARYLPEGIDLPVRGRPITLADLATHSSGLPRLPKGLLRLSLRNRTNPYASFTVEHLSQAIAETRLRSGPGETVRYSNFGFGLLGHVLALRAGTTYEELVRERICRPLGLADTSITVEPCAEPRLATGHDRRGRPVPAWDLPALAGAGALRSTVADMLAFLALYVDAPETRLGRAAALAAAPRLVKRKQSQGLGWTRWPLRGTSAEIVWHNGGTGGFRSFAGFVDGAELAVAVLSNSARSVDAIGFRLLETLSER